MKSSEKKHSIFGPSGCISEKAFFLYLNNKLSEDEKNTLEKHASECLLCFEALESITGQQNPKELQTEFSQIKKDFHLLNSYNKPSANPKNIRKIVLIGASSIAASFLLIFVSYFLINHLFLSSQKHQDIAYQTQVLPETSPDKENSGSNENQTKIFYKPQNPQTIEQENVADNINKNSYTREPNDISVSIAGQKTTSIYNGHIDDNVFYDNTQPKETEAKNDSITGKIVDDQLSLNILNEETAPLNFEYKAEKKKEPSKTDAKGGVAQPGRAETQMDAETAFSFYRNGKYAEAIPYFEKILLTDKHNQKVIYHLGMSYYHSGNKAKALAEFDKIIKNKKSPYYTLALWQKSLILAENQEKDKAIELLKIIVTASDTLKNKALQKIEELKHDE